MRDPFENSLRLGQAVTYTDATDQVTFQGLHGVNVGGTAIDYHNDAYKGFNPAAWIMGDSTDYGRTGGGGISMPAGDTRIEFRQETYTGIGLGYYLGPEGLDPENSAGGNYGTHLQLDRYESNRTDTSVKLTDRSSGAGMRLGLSTDAGIQRGIHNRFSNDPLFAMPDVMNMDGASSPPLRDPGRLSLEVNYPTRSSD